MERTQAIYKAYKKQRDRANKLIKSLLVLAFINMVLSLGDIFVGSSVLTYTVWVLLTVWTIGEIVYLVIQHKRKQLFNKYMEEAQSEYSRRTNNL